MTRESLRTEGLTKAFGGVVAVNDASVELVHGKINGLIGPNGSGKTTFFNLVTGMIRADSGRITTRGARDHPALRPIASRTPASAAPSRSAGSSRA